MPRLGIVGSGLGLGHGGVPLTGGGCVPVAKIDGSVSAGATFTHPADGVIAWTQTTLPSGGSVLMLIRQQDATNFWRVYVGADGALALYEVVANVATSRGFVPGVIANGDRIVVVVEGNTIKVYEAGTLRITYASAANFATATAGQLASLGSGGAVSDLKVWSLACRAQEGV